ncbi:MAG: PAS domain-containing sensor histidine kinase [Ignavibacteria bacterium]|nr:PAS domain-containing sensor histidine kinase [Ignavibacteria bacterium]
MKTQLNLQNLLIKWFFEQNDFGVILLDTNLTIIDVNDWVLQKRKLKKHELLNKNIFEVFPEIKARKLDLFLFDALEGLPYVLSNKIHKYFIQIPISSSYGIQYEQHKTEIIPLVEEGKTHSLLIKIENVTERVENELKLLKTIQDLELANKEALLNLEKFQSLAENLPEIILRLDVQLNLIYTNKNIAPQSFPINEFIEFLKQNLFNDFSEITKLKTKKELKLIYHNKKDFHFSITLIPEVNLDDQLVSFLVVCRDITSEEESKMHLQKLNEELNKLNANKDKLFSVIAHDLRSPFNYLLNVVDLLDESFDELSSEDIKKFIHEFKLTTKNIYNLLENLLTWANIQRRKFELKKTTFYLKEALDTLLLIFEKIASQKEIKIVNLVDKNLTINADPDFFNIVLRNLISNSLKFTNKGGQITIDAKANDENIEIIFKDTGIGMTEEQIKNLFFIEKTKSEKGTMGEKGSGLGLILVKDVVDLHRGKIVVESEIGKGSTFKIYLPNK